MCEHAYVCVSVSMVTPDCLPWSGIVRQQGREMGVMECWYTRADRLPGETDRETCRQTYRQTERH